MMGGLYHTESRLGRNDNGNLMRLMTPQRLFAILLILTGSLSICYIWWTQGACLDLIMPQKELHFCDFFSHILYVREPAKVYDVDYNACFPPLAYIMYWALGKGLPSGAVVTNEIYGLDPYALLLYVVYNMILAVLFYDSVICLAKQKGCGGGYAKAIALALCTSGVYIFVLLWIGNSALVTCIFLIKAMELREKEDKWSRELALVLIALAAGFKIYPAIFGILYLKEKRYREAGRLILYGMIAFFVPFLFFGGFHGLLQMLRNQAELHTGYLYYGWRSIQCTWNQIDKKFLHFNVPIIGKILSVLYAIMGLIAFWVTSVEWKRLYLLCSLMVVVPLWSGHYTSIYFSIALICFLCGERKNKMDYLYALLFAGMFCFFTWNTPAITNITGDISFTVRYVAIYGMCFLLVAEEMWKMSRKLIGRFCESK